MVSNRDVVERNKLGRQMQLNLVLPYAMNNLAIYWLRDKIDSQKRAFFIFWFEAVHVEFTY